MAMFNDSVSLAIYGDVCKRYRHLVTYQGRKDKFKCDTCNRVEYVDNGFPDGWVYLKAGGKVEHACSECRKCIPREQQFAAGQK
jgi:hypothetical protein